MSEIEIEVYEMDTNKGTFALKVYEDAERTYYVGKLEGPSLILAQKPGTLTHDSDIVAEEYRDPSKDKVIERCKERITELGGKITRCSNLEIAERPALQELHDA